jgi:hypothetical protein
LRGRRASAEQRVWIFKQLHDRVKEARAFSTIDDAVVA